MFKCKKSLPLKKRIKRTLRINNFFSVFFIGILITIILMLAVHFLGSFFTSAQAYQTSKIITSEWDESPNFIDQHEYMSKVLENLEFNPELLSEDVIEFDEEDMALYFDEEFRNDSAFEALGPIIQYEVYIDDPESDFGPFFYTSYDDSQMNDQNGSISDKMTNAINPITTAKIYKNPSREYIKEHLDMTDTNTIDTNDILSEMKRKDMETPVIGHINVRINPNYVAIFIALAAFVSLVILIVFLLINKIITAIISSFIARPITEVSNKIECLAQGDIETSMNTTIDVDKPVIEVKQLMDSTNLMMSKMTEYSHTLENQNAELEAQKYELEDQRTEMEAQRDELEAQNVALEERSHSLTALNNAYLGRTLKLQNLMDNVDQGFLTFNSDLHINGEYSLKCEPMLKIHTKLTDQPILPLLYDQIDDIEFAENLFNKIFTSDIEQRDLYMSLLPEELIKGGLVLSLKFKLVKDEVGHPQMLLIMTDVTDQREMEKQIASERNTLQMIVKVLQDRSEFLDVLKDFKLFASSDFAALAGTDYEETLRAIHTHKGIFAQYYMKYTADYLNLLEDGLYNSFDVEAMANIDYQSLLAPLEADLAVVESYVGHDYIYDDSVYTIREERITRIENRIKELLPSSEYQKIKPLIKSIRYKDIRTLLTPYADYSIKLGERFNKSIRPFEIEGDTISVDTNIYNSVTRSLIHLFRNAVDHGIEEPDVRLEIGKDEVANLVCRTDSYSDYFTITISDDGSGLSLDSIRDQAIQSGLLIADEEISDQELYQLVFADGLSTKETVTALSGRGVGLAAVRNSVEVLGGAIKVESEPGVGSKFIITLPYITDTSITAFTPEKLLKQISHVAETYLGKLNIPLNNYQLESKQKVTLNRISALINIKGSMEAILIISVNESMGNQLVKSFMVDDVSGDDVIQYMEDVLGEVTNTVMGNVLGLLEEDEVYLNLGIPALITNKDAYIKYTQSEIVSVSYEHNDNILTINLLLVDNGDGDALYEI